MNRLLAVTSLAALALTAPAFAETPKPDQHIVISPEQVQWQPAPAKLPPGAQVAVLEGDPNEEGFFTLRIKLPDGYRIPPHTHPAAERVTVLSGTFKLGKGKTFDPAKTTTLPPGSYFSLAPASAHFAIAQGETVVQISTMGPWDIIYVNPADDPSRKRG